MQRYFPAMDSDSGSEYVASPTPSEECDDAEEYDLADTHEASTELEDESPLYVAEAIDAVEEQIRTFETVPPDFDEETLFDGNIRPAEYYRRAVHELDESVFDRKEYAAGTEALIRLADSKWREYVSLSLSLEIPSTDGHTDTVTRSWEQTTKMSTMPASTLTSCTTSLIGIWAKGLVRKAERNQVYDRRVLLSPSGVCFG